MAPSERDDLSFYAGVDEGLEAGALDRAQYRLHLLLGGPQPA